VFGLLVTTMPEVPGYRVKKILGLVYGMTIRTRGLGGQIVASLESLVGGEIVRRLRRQESSALNVWWRQLRRWEQTQ